MPAPDPRIQHFPLFLFPVQMSVSLGNIIHKHWNSLKQLRFLQGGADSIPVSSDLINIHLIRPQGRMGAQSCCGLLGGTKSEIFTPWTWESPWILHFLHPMMLLARSRCVRPHLDKLQGGTMLLSSPEILPALSLEQTDVKHLVRLLNIG